MEAKWNESLLMFMHNLSPYYVLCVVISIFALVFTVLYSKKWRTEFQELKEKEMREREPDTGRRFPSQETLLKKVASNMTPEQLEQEREAEKAQLNAILKLLKEQENYVPDMDDLKQQLSLYR